MEIGIRALDEFGLATYAVVGIGDDSQTSTSEKSLVRHCFNHALQFFYVFFFFFQNRELYQFNPSSVTLTEVERNATETVEFGISEGGGFTIEDIRVHTLGSYFRPLETRFTLIPSTCPAGNAVNDIY